MINSLVAFFLHFSIWFWNCTQANHNFMGKCDLNIYKHYQYVEFSPSNAAFNCCKHIKKGFCVEEGMHNKNHLLDTVTEKVNFMYACNDISFFFFMHIFFQKKICTIKEGSAIFLVIFYSFS